MRHSVIAKSSAHGTDGGVSASAPLCQALPEAANLLDAGGDPSPLPPAPPPPPPPGGAISPLEGGGGGCVVLSASIGRAAGSAVTSPEVGAPLSPPPFFSSGATCIVTGPLHKQKHEIGGGADPQLSQKTTR
jgi:hypothetical protein